MNSSYITARENNHQLIQPKLLSNSNAFSQTWNILDVSKTLINPTKCPKWPKYPCIFYFVPKLTIRIKWETIGALNIFCEIWLWQGLYDIFVMQVKFGKLWSWKVWQCTCVHFFIWFFCELIKGYFKVASFISNQKENSISFSCQGFVVHPSFHFVLNEAKIVFSSRWVCNISHK